MSEKENSKVVQLPNLKCLKTGKCSSEDEKKKDIAEKFKMPERRVLDIINSYIHNQGDPTCKNIAHDERGYSVLHLAAERNLLLVAEKLLESGFEALTPACSEEKNKVFALHLAIEKHFDDMATLIIRHISNDNVRKLFLGNGKHRDEVILKLNYLIREGFVKTVHAVLDCLKDDQDNGLSTVYVKLLEEDENGLEPDDKAFNSEHHTAFHNLAKADKEVNIHPIIGMLVHHKWSSWGLKHFLLNFLLYFVSLFSLTVSAVTAVGSTDVWKYDTTSQKFRAVFELVFCCLSLMELATEICQMIKHRLSYWKQFYNWIEFLSLAVIFVVLILRLTTEDAHWFVLAGAYMLWIVKIFKYAAVNSQMATYTESLRQILTRHFIPFVVLFIVVDVAFGGVFLLVLKGEGTLQKHEETSSIHGIWFVGLRTLIEAQPVVDYTGSEGYGKFGIVIMLVFLTMTIVILLNILIAQLSDTYAKIQSDAVKSVRAHKVALLATFERDETQVSSSILKKLSRFGCCAWLSNKLDLISKERRKKYYKAKFEDVDLKAHQLSNSTLIEDINEQIHQMHRQLIKTDLKAQTLNSRLRNLEKKLDNRF